MTKLPAGTLSKVPEVTLGFWVIKVLATTLGETGGDAVTMSMNLGYAIGSFIFIGIFAATAVAQISAKAFHPFLYWVTIIATTTLGTTMADFADRSLGIGYFGGSSILFAGLIASLTVWRWSEGSISVNTVATPRVEMFYWVAILFSQTLGTALGYFYTKISHTLLFWAAFILTRPLGATLGDLLDKPHDQGGLDVSRYVASAILAATIVALVLILPQRAGVHPGAREQKA